MVVCRYYQQGNCRFGERCRFEHPDFNSNSNVSNNNAYKWYGGGYQGGDGGYRNRDGGSNRGVTFKDSFSTSNRFEALSQNDNRQQKPKGNAGLQGLTANDMVNTISADMESWEQSHMWQFSCYTYFKDGTCIPGFDDVSPEELRLEAYEAQKSGNFQQYVQKVKDLINKFRMFKSELARPSMQTKQKLIQVIEEDRKRLERQFQSQTSGGKSVFGQSTDGLFSNSGQQSTSVFGAPSTGLFGKTEPNQGLFGKSQPAEGLFGNSQSTGGLFGNNQSTGGLFGKSQSSTSGFGGSQSGASSGFGNSQSTTTGLFGKSQPTGGLFGSSSQSEGSIFGNIQSGAGTSIFGNTQQQQQQTSFGSGFQQSSSTEPFGIQASSNGNSAFFGSSSIASRLGTGASGSYGSTGSTAFGQQSTNSGAAGSTPTPPAAQPSHTSGAKSQLYTPLAELTAEERQQYEATHFTAGRLPTRPPPKELC